MITRFALFEGYVQQAQTEAFRAAVLTEILPKWRAFPGALAVRVCFENERDQGSAEIPLILAISYADRAAVDLALASPERAQAKAATESVMSRFFKGTIHHHITDAHDHVS
jgi:quinol monooxygenase YgiN